MEVAVTALIQAVGLVYQAASTPGFISATLGPAGTGGVLQSPVPTRGVVN